MWHIYEFEGFAAAFVIYGQDQRSARGVVLVYESSSSTNGTAAKPQRSTLTRKACQDNPQPQSYDGMSVPAWLALPVQHPHTVSVLLQHPHTSSHASRVPQAAEADAPLSKTTPKAGSSTNPHLHSCNTPQPPIFIRYSLMDVHPFLSPEAAEAGALLSKYTPKAGSSTSPIDAARPTLLRAQLALTRHSVLMCCTG
jgi:hypothetical protein